MPIIYELFGFPLEDRSEHAEQVRRSATCPFTEAPCDGGGNIAILHQLYTSRRAPLGGVALRLPHDL
jgi:hypothetical protein